MLKLISLLFIASFCSVYAQTLSAEYNIKVCSTTEFTDTLLVPFNYCLKIEAIYKFQDNSENDFAFSAKAKMDMGLSFGINDPKLKLTDSENNEIDKSLYSYSFKLDTLKLKLNRKIKNFKMYCNYIVFGGSVAEIDPTNARLFPVRRNLFIWSGDGFRSFGDAFLKYSKLIVKNKKMSITAPLNLYLTSTLKESDKLKISDSTQTMSLLFENENEEINSRSSICALDTSIYSKQSYSIDNSLINFYIRRDSLYKLSKYLDTICSLMKTVNNYHFKSNNSDLDVIELDYTWRGNMMGRTFNGLMYVDIDFIKYYKNLIHEYLHTKLPLPNLKSKGKILFAESIVEYLANYISFNKDAVKFKKALDERLTKKSSKTKDSVSLYELNENYNNTFDIVYAYGPSVIYKFAHSIGEEEFFLILQRFFKIHNTNESYTYDDFIQYLRDSKIEMKYIDELDRQVKEIY
jgi:hypothetical protein